MAEKLEKNSHLRFADLFNVDGVVFWDTPEFPDIVPQHDDSLHYVAIEEVGRLDLIAYDAYGDSELWWVIALANNMDHPAQFGMGDVLMIPSPRYVNDELLNFKRKK